MPVLQLLFLEPLDLLVLALGDGGQRENLRPVDLMLVGVKGCHFANCGSVDSAQPNN